MFVIYIQRHLRRHIEINFSYYLCDFVAKKDAINYDSFHTLWMKYSIICGETKNHVLTIR